MKKYILLLVLTVYLLPAFAQPCDSNFLGTKSLYHVPKAQIAQVPAGYQPVFINYAGRHGARHLTKAPETEHIFKLIYRADSSGLLTGQGHQLKNMISVLQKIEQGNTKNISAEGKTELQDIANRLYAGNKNVFKNAPKITVTITKEVRTKQSADAFLIGLQQHIKNLTIVKQSINDTILRFYDLSPAYLEFEKKGNWLKPMAELQQQMRVSTINHKIAALFFEPAFLKHISATEEANFTADLFGFSTIIYSLQTEIREAGYTLKDVGFKSFFTCDELSTLAKVDAAEDFLKKGPGTNAQGIQVKIAAPLLVDFLQSTDAFLNGNTVNANFRFAHAETIAPFAALLGIASDSVSAQNINKFENVWQAENVIPLSANIQWILYKNISGKYLIKILLNEKPVSIKGLKPVYKDYYSWGDVKKFYVTRLNQIGISINSTMSQYLHNVQ